MLQTYSESANRPLLSNKKQWLIATGMFSERNDVMLDAHHVPSRLLLPRIVLKRQYVIEIY